jgi:hypothetical protein
VNFHIAPSPLEMSITAMKIRPFDVFAQASNGRDISTRR